MTSKIRDIQVDDAITLDASYRMDARDRRLIDDEIRGTQQHVVDSLMSGSVGTSAILHADSDSVVPGDCLAVKGAFVTKASTASLTNAGAVAGVVKVAAAPNTRVYFAVGGTVPPTITGLSDGPSSTVRCNPTSGRLERVESYTEGDYPVGICNTDGGLAILLGSTSSSTVPFVTDTYTIAAGSPDITAGQVVCVSASIHDPPQIILAESEPISAAGISLGVSLEDGSVGEAIKVVIAGLVKNELTGLGDGKKSLVVVDSDGNLARKAGVSFQDYIVGTCDTKGNLTVKPLAPSLLEPTNVVRFGGTGNVGDHPLVNGYDQDTPIHTALDAVLEDGNGYSKVLYFPTLNNDEAATAQYDLQYPLRITSGNIKIKGDHKSRVNLRTTDFFGPSVFVCNTLNLPLTDPLVDPYSGEPVGRGWELGPDSLGGNSSRALLYISDSIGCQYLNGLSAFTIEFFFKMTTTYSGNELKCIVASAGQLSDFDNTEFNHCAFSFLALGHDIYGTANQLQFNLTTSDGTYTITDPGSMAEGVLYHIAASYDGSTVRLFRSTPGSSVSSPVASSAATGSVEQLEYEATAIGRYPFGAYGRNIFADAPESIIHGIRIQNNAKYTGSSFTSPTTTWWSLDGTNNIFTLNYDSFYKDDMPKGYHGTNMANTFIAPIGGHSAFENGVGFVAEDIFFGGPLHIHASINTVLNNCGFGGFPHGLVLEEGCYVSKTDGLNFQCGSTNQCDLLEVGSASSHHKKIETNGAYCPIALISCTSQIEDIYVSNWGTGPGIQLEGQIECVNALVLGEGRTEIAECAMLVGGGRSGLQCILKNCNLSNRYDDEAGTHGGVQIQFSGGANHSVIGGALETEPDCTQLVSFRNDCNLVTFYDVQRNYASVPGPAPWTTELTTPIIVYPSESIGVGTAQFTTDDDFTLDAETFTNNAIVIEENPEDPLSDTRYLLLPTWGGSNNAWERTFVNAASYPVILKATDSVGATVTLDVNKHVTVLCTAHNIIPIMDSQVLWANDLAGSTDSSQQVVALTGHADPSPVAGRDLNLEGSPADNATYVRTTSARLVWDRASVNPGLYVEDVETGTDTAPSTFVVEGQAADPDTEVSTVGGPVQLVGGKGAGSAPHGFSGLNSGAYDILVSEELGRNIATCPRAEFAAEGGGTEHRIYSGSMGGTTTTSTSADQTIATIAIPTYITASWGIVVRVTERVGNTQTEMGMVAQVAHWNGSSFAAGSGSDGIATDLSANSLSLKAQISSGNLVIKLTPVSSSSTTHSVSFEMQAIQ